MNILCVIDSLGSGGAQRQIVNLALSFKDRGHSVDFLVYHSDPFYYDILKNSDIQVIEVIENNYLKRILKMRKVIRNGKYDAVLSFLEAANFISTLAGFPYRKWKLIVGERSANPNIFKSFKLRIYRWFHLFASAVVANSYENIKMVKKVNPLISEKKLHVIYNLIDFDTWKFNQVDYIYRNNGKFNLTVVASHQYLKNLNGLVEAVNLLNDDEKENLIINWYGGDRPDNSKMEAINKISLYKLDRIFNFHEPTLNISSKVNQADAIGLFSFYEGLPNVVCEAMVNQKPVIAADISDVGLLIEKKFIFDPNSPEDISKKIRLLLSLDEAALQETGEINYNSSVILFDKESIVKKYISIMS
ncbi:glycosyltransferase [Acinetobacter sp. YH12085]|uniref:glycosyltransferase n=1 Tax=Acinetobacter sp. YH12085 TaxID=2601077 RepID=UPI0015D2731D|nr:glycosyltransferase [Acinetobacter sp. YH12085]